MRDERRPYHNDFVKMMVNLVPMLADAMHKLEWFIAAAPPGKAFVTCDAPVIITRPMNHNPLLGVGLTTPGAEKIIPLTSRLALLMGDEVLKLWRETGATVFLITHALDEAAMLADRIGVMSARPGRIIDLVETGWPRERDSRIVENADFGAVTSRLWKTLRDESLKTMGRMGHAEPQAPRRDAQREVQ